MKYTLISLLLLCCNIGLFAQENATQEISINTELGVILVELYPDKAPLTVENFMKYVDQGYFRDGSFYRTVTMENQPDNDAKIEVIQGGRSRSGVKPEIAPIAHETTETTGILHLDGTISMARSKPGTATSEFFICINNQPSLDYGGKRNPDKQGFAAFGKVISGMDVVRAIHQSDCEKQTLKPTIRIKDIKPGRSANIENNKI